MKRLVTALALAAVFATAACSSSTSGGGEGTGSALMSNSVSAPASTPPVSTAPVSAPASSAVSSPAAPVSSAPAGGGGLSQQEAQDALVTVTDVGGGFTQTTSDDSSDPLPCTPNDPPLDKQSPPAAKAQADFANSAGSALVSEEITTYADEATTESVLAAGEKGFDCPSATITTDTGKLKVTIGAATDLTSAVNVKVDKCEGWSITAQGVNLIVIVARLGQQIVAMTFTAASSVDTSTLPDSRTLTEVALKKVVAAL
jgi:hypothetical protein